MVTIDAKERDLPNEAAQTANLVKSTLGWYLMATKERYKF